MHIAKNNFKSFEYKAKSLGNTESQTANAADGILKNATIAVPLKYLSNFWRPYKMSLINCNVELKLKWTKYCILSAADNENHSDNDNDDNANKIIFNIKDTKLFVPVKTLSARDNQTLSKFLSKRFERLIYWNEYKTKSENKNVTNKFRYFLKSNFVGFN